MAADSISCQGRCALFVHKDDNPKCQCDGLCAHYKDCCPDFRNVCLTKIVPKKSTELAKWVGLIVGVVFVVIIVFAVAYFLAIRRKETYRSPEGGRPIPLMGRTPPHPARIRPQGNPPPRDVGNS